VLKRLSYWCCEDLGGLYDCWMVKIRDVVL
jgi:hypothetical protein